MCIKFIKKEIEKEKNIEIRKRQEENIKYRCTVILAILFAGGFVAGKKSLSGALLGGLLTFILLVMYLFFDLFFLEKYSKYTDSLIKKNSNKSSKA